MIETLRRWRDALDAAIEALERLPPALLEGLAAPPVKARGRAAAARGTNGSSEAPSPAGAAAATEDTVVCAAPECDRRFVPRTSGVMQRFCSKACRGKVAAAARRERKGTAKTEPIPPDSLKPLPDLPATARPFRTPSLAREPREVVAERERHLALPEL